MSLVTADRLELNRLAGQRARLQGEADSVAMTRLNELVRSVIGPIRYRLEFDYDELRRPLIKGLIEARVEMMCQRCLRPMSVTLMAEPVLAAVASEAAAVQLPDEAEALECEDWTASLSNVLEDELLLVTPLAPMHEPGAPDAPPECVPWQAEDGGFAEDANQRRFPFAALADKLKDTD